MMPLRFLILLVLFVTPVAAQDVRVAASDQSVAILRSRRIKTDADAAELITNLTRLRRTDAAGEVLVGIDDADWNPRRKAEFVRRIPPAMRLRLQTATDLPDGAAAKLDAMLAALRTVSRDPATIDSDLDAVVEQTRDRSAAAERLSQAGEAAVARIAGRLLGGGVDTSTRSRLLATMLDIDPIAGDALVPAAVYGDPARADRAATLLSAIDPRRYGPAVAAVRSSGDARTAELLRDHFSTLRDRSLGTRRGEATETVWSPAADDGVPSYTNADAAVAAARRAVDAAAMIRRAGLQSPPDAADALAADAGYRILSDADWGDDAQVQSLVAAHPDASLDAAIRGSIELDDAAALLALVRVAAEQPELPPSLIRVVDSGQPIVRYEAAMTLARRRGASGYADSTSVKRTLGELARMTDAPVAVVVETRREIAGLVAASLRDSGYGVERVTSVESMRDRLARGGDIALVVAKLNLPDRTPLELVDRVREIPRTRDVPVVFYADPVVEGTLLFDTAQKPGVALPVIDRRHDAPVLQIDFPNSPRAFDALRRSIRSRRRVPTLSPAERRLFRDEATRLLTR